MALPRNLRIGGVEVGAEINLTATGCVETAGVGIEVADIILDGAVRGAEKNPLIADIEKVGAFGGAGICVGKLKENATIFPLSEAAILGLVDVHDSLTAL